MGWAKEGMWKGRSESRGRADLGEAARNGKKHLIRVCVLMSTQQNLAGDRLPLFLLQ